MTDPKDVKIYCTKCNVDVTDECLMRLDTMDLPDPLVSMKSCPYCHQLTTLKVRFKGRYERCCSAMPRRYAWAF